jgi:DNA-binding transcriptional ArsR family regulator
MVTVASLAKLAALVGNPARAGMLMALMGGRALTATELAHVAGISPQTASGHLGQLCRACYSLNIQAEEVTACESLD